MTTNMTTNNTSMDIWLKLQIQASEPVAYHCIMDSHHYSILAVILGFDKTQQLKCNETFNIPLRMPDADEATSCDWSDGGTMMTDRGAPVLPEPDGAASSAAAD